MYDTLSHCDKFRSYFYNHLFGHFYWQNFEWRADMICFSVYGVDVLSSTTTSHGTGSRGNT